MELVHDRPTDISRASVSDAYSSCPRSASLYSVLHERVSKCCSDMHQEVGRAPFSQSTKTLTLCRYERRSEDRSPCSAQNNF